MEWIEEIFAYPMGFGFLLQLLDLLFQFVVIGEFFAFNVIFDLEDDLFDDFAGASVPGIVIATEGFAQERLLLPGIDPEQVVAVYRRVYLPIFSIVEAELDIPWYCDRGYISSVGLDPCQSYSLQY